MEEKKELTVWDYFVRGSQILAFLTGLSWGVYSKVISPTFVFVQEYRMQTATFKSELLYIKKDIEELKLRSQRNQKNQK